MFYSNKLKNLKKLDIVFFLEKTGFPKVFIKVLIAEKDLKIVNKMLVKI